MKTRQADPKREQAKKERREEEEEEEEEEQMEDMDHCEWKLALKELIHGQDVATNLGRCLYSAHEDEDADADGDAAQASVRADLAGKLVESFTNALSLLGYYGGAEPDGVSRFSSSTVSLPDPKGINSGMMDGRGRYKRRKSCFSWTETTPVLIDDGHAWRKYGQKSILNSDFPRGYFRCTHKFEQKCEATKQVQRISADPPLYQTTYFGHHTCKNNFDSSQFIFEDSYDEEGTSSNLVCFDGNTPKNARDNPFFSSTFFSKSSLDEHVGRYDCDEHGKLQVEFGE